MENDPFIHVKRQLGWILLGIPLVWGLQLQLLSDPGWRVLTLLIYGVGAALWLAIQTHRTVRKHGPH